MPPIGPKTKQLQSLAKPVYQRVATAPDGHEIGSNDGIAWFDTKTHVPMPPNLRHPVPVKLDMVQPMPPIQRQVTPVSLPRTIIPDKSAMAIEGVFSGPAIETRIVPSGYVAH